MKAKIFVILFFGLIANNIAGQVNNVLNYSFEQNTGCAGMGNCSWTQVTNWYQPTILGASWYSSFCPGTIGVPQNYLGYQYARTGVSYGAMGIDTSGYSWNYITGTLSGSLSVNKKYCITFYVSLGDSVWWAMSAIGAYLSNDSICISGDAVLPYTPQIENPLNNIITDKIDWLPISGEFIASGGEKFITIGDFYSDAMSNVDSVGHGGTVAGWNEGVQSYYYVDDVYVRMLTIANAGGNGDTICNGDGVVIGKDTTTTGVSFHWLPTTGLSNPNIAQPMASPTVTTTYTLTVVNDSIHGCNCADSVTKDSVTVFVYPAMNITNYFINDTGSNSGSAGVYVTGGSQPYTYLWKPNGQTTDSITGLGASIDTCIITDANGCTYTTKIVVKNTTGIANVESESISFNLYPNPNNGNFTLAYNLGNQTSGIIEIYNQIGMEVAEYLLASSIGSRQISDPNLSQGLYIYKVYTGSEVIKIGKIVIMK